MSSQTERFLALYRRYGPAIYARCLRMLSDAPAAEDATQEIFLRVAKHLDKAPDTSAALAWIYRIATNHCLNELRNGRRHPALAGPFIDDVSNAANGADEQGDAAMAHRDLAHRIMERSPKHLSVPAWLYHVDGMSHEEVGKTLGLSRRTIINYLSEFQARARKYVRRAT